MPNELKKCDICRKTSNTEQDVVLFGDWMTLQDITVHYFCLLLSTNLPQRGNDFSGILGFLKRDIRNEIQAAVKRTCCYCHESGASIACHKCKEYFHLVCGDNNKCLFQFHNEFNSYCHMCMPLTKFQRQAKKEPPSRKTRCYICKEMMGIYSPTEWIYGKCCKNGYVHRICMLQYALASGYYLKCIWCKDTNFRIAVRMQGIFVPDRDAQWEIQRDNYRDLHKGHSRCDMEPCLCPYGRDYIKGKWPVILCALCGSFGAHNPICLPGMDKQKNKVNNFKCDTCKVIETRISADSSTTSDNKLNKTMINRSTYLKKHNNSFVELSQMSETPNFTDTESQTSTSSSTTTVVPRTANTSHSQTSRSSQDSLIKSILCPPKSVHFASPAVSTISTSAVDKTPDSEIFENDTTGEGECTILLMPTPTEKEAAVSTPSVNANKTINNAPSTKDIQLNTQAFLNADNPAPSTEANKITLDAIDMLQQSEENKGSDGNTDNGITQSPVITSTSPEALNNSSQENSNPNTNFVTFDVYELHEQSLLCLGMSTVRIDLNSTRFAGKTIDDIKKSAGLLLPSDVISHRSGELGIFKDIYSIIAKYK